MDLDYRSGIDMAIVIGGSMAGLLTARVLADYYEHVTLVERDGLAPSADSRRGVPQGRHTHGLLASGCQVLEILFPGISDQLVAAGAVLTDGARDIRRFLEGACHIRFPSELQELLMSRPFLESFVRERVRNLPNVHFRDNQEVKGLVASADKRRVTGVRIGEEVLAGDLVVDTSGRGSHSPQWLEALGYPKPKEERVEIALSYTTQFFRRHPNDLGGDLGVIMPPTVSGKRGGVMLAQEGFRWTVTLISHFGPGAPAELAGFIEFARSLPAPYIYEVIRYAEPVSDPVNSRFPASIRRRYEQLERFPQGYLVLGDAIASFNPAFGQGMSVAALETMELKAALSEGTGDLAQRMFQRASKVIDTPWRIAVGNDLRIPEAVGPRTFADRAIHAYLARLHKAAHRDTAVALAFQRVANLLDSPPSLMQPRVAFRVLWGSLRLDRAWFPLPRAQSVHAIQKEISGGPCPSSRWTNGGKSKNQN
jgi:2-polyprenyl-6-methoxyphenol hydroxylase-like FAD-dependent oxidoreductase